MLEVLGRVADDRDRRRLEPEAHRLGGEERPVAVAPLAPDELRARDDDRRPRAAQVVARVILRAVTTNVVPPRKLDPVAVHATVTFCGSASASCRERPSNDLCWPRSSVPL